MLWPLVVSGLIDNAQNTGNGAVGSPDQLLYGPRGITKDLVAINECKSTHNLPWPMTAAEVVMQYTDAKNQDPPTRESIRAWTHIGHGLGQLVGYTWWRINVASAL